MPRRQPNKQQSAQTTSVPAPIGGLNAINSIAAMPPTDAIIMDNMFPSPTTVDSRAGRKDWVTGITGWVESLMAYNPNSGSNKLFAGANNSIYDVTSAGAVGAAVVAGQTSNRYQYVAFENSAAVQYIMLANGADSIQIYNGTTWQLVNAGSAPIAITGVTTANIINLNAFKNRIWLIEKFTFNAYYLPLNSIGGAATLFPLGPLFKLGGYLVGMYNWAQDSSYGVDDYAAFVSSQGEVVVYKGIDPAFAATFALQGTYRIGRPIGNRPFTKIAGDVIGVTADGIISFSKSLLSERAKPEDAISYKIVNLITTDVTSYAANFGWQVVYYPIGNKILVNVPQSENSRQYQYVMNTITSSWCTFGYYNSPWNAACFELLGDSMFYGGNGVVEQCDTGNDDAGTSIQIELKTAFSYFDKPGAEKDFKLVRPVFLADGTFQPSFSLNMDFANSPPTGSTLYMDGGFAWNTTLWNTKPWSNFQTVQKSWLVASGTGYAAALHMKGNILAMTVKMQSIDYVYEYGGVL